MGKPYYLLRFQQVDKVFFLAVFDEIASVGDFIPLQVVTLIGEQKIFGYLEIFPNPVVELVNIAIEFKKESRANVEVYNMVGSKLISSDFDNLGTAVSNLRIPVQ